VVAELLVIGDVGEVLEDLLARPADRRREGDGLHRPPIYSGTAAGGETAPRRWMRTARPASLLRTGSRSGAWFDVVLDEGKNRQLRRIFAAVDVPIQRLVRVSIGRLALGDLAKGAWRMLRPDEVDLLGGKA